MTEAAGSRPAWPFALGKLLWTQNCEGCYAATGGARPGKLP